MEKLIPPLLGLLLWMNPVHAGEGISAQAYLVVESATGKIFLEKNSLEPRQIASLTKVATVLVALNWLDAAGRSALDKRTIVQENRLAGGANPLRLRAGDEITVETTLYAAVMASDNASAEVLAEYIGRQMSPGKKAWRAVDFFVGKMNQLAASLGMEKTRFVNPHGLEKPNELGVSCARDVAILAMAALRHPGFLRLCSSRERRVSYYRGGKKIVVTLENTNELVGTRGIDGMKTGTTRRAGACLLSTATRKFSGDPPGKERRLVAVVLGSQDRFRDSVLLLDSAWKDYEKQIFRQNPGAE